jgi:hypothetical protein
MAIEGLDLLGYDIAFRQPLLSANFLSVIRWKMVCLGVDSDEKIELGIAYSWFIGQSEDCSHARHKGYAFFLQGDKRSDQSCPPSGDFSLIEVVERGHF